MHGRRLEQRTDGDEKLIFNFARPYCGIFQMCKIAMFSYSCQRSVLSHLQIVCLNCVRRYPF